MLTELRGRAVESSFAIRSPEFSLFQFQVVVLGSDEYLAGRKDEPSVFTAQ